MALRRGDVPLDRDASGRFLFWLVAVMVYLAALALVGAMTIERALTRWEAGLAGRLSVQVPPSAPGTPAGAADPAVERVIALLIATPGVKSAAVLEPEEIASLLEPWLGPGVEALDLPVPALISVTFDGKAALDLNRLARRIAEVAPGAVVDDHQAWLGKVRDLAHVLALIAALVVVLVGACAMAIVIFATRMGLSVHGQVIQLLHLIGAQDSYVARQFQSHAMRFALRGGVLGLGLAAASVVVVARALDRAQAVPLPEMSPRPLDWSILALLPIVVAGVAMLTARVTVLRTLGRMP